MPAKIRTHSRKTVYVIQDNLDDKGWKNFRMSEDYPEDKRNADWWFKTISADTAYWTMGGRRKWRMIQRVIVEYHLDIVINNVGHLT